MATQPNSPSERSTCQNRPRSEPVGQNVLICRLVTGNERREEDPRGQKRRRYPEDRELHVPGAGKVVGEEGGEIQTEEAGEIGPIVLGHPSHQHLQEEQLRHRKEEPVASPLGRCELHVARRPKDHPGLVAPVPAQEVPTSERREEHARPAEQGGE